MKPIARKRRRFVAILLSPLLAVAFLAGFALTAVGRRNSHNINLKMRTQVHKTASIVTLEIINKEEELQVQ
jgi:hypothetical protein